MLTDAREDNQAVSWAGVVLRGMFLACSWTWCIGMFFPVFFVGDFGFWGWVAFAVPNVLGAGAMGWVLRRPGASVEMVAKHAAAMRWFSIVTLLFHVSFGVWFWDVFVGSQKGTYFGGAYFLVLLWITGFNFANMKERGWAWYTPATFAVSLFCGVAAGIGSDTLRPPPISGLYSSSELLMTLPVLVFGFGLCPYLDLTFHRVRRTTPGVPGTVSFWIGFCCFFLPMIVLTLFYSTAINAGSRISLFIAFHVLCQSAFTAAAHLRELLPLAPPHDAELDSTARENIRTVIPYFWLAAVILIAAYSLALAYAPDLRPPHPNRRLVYELFMSFYALVFPAYVWIVIVERGLPRATRLTLYVLALVLASPCLWLGYIEQHYIWLLPGVAIPLALPYLGKALAARNAPR